MSRPAGASTKACPGTLAQSGRAGRSVCFTVPHRLQTLCMAPLVPLSSGSGSVASLHWQSLLLPHLAHTSVRFDGGPTGLTAAFASAELRGPLHRHGRGVQRGGVGPRDAGLHGARRRLHTAQLPQHRAAAARRPHLLRRRRPLRRRLPVRFRLTPLSNPKPTVLLQCPLQKFQAHSGVEGASGDGTCARLVADAKPITKP